MSAQALAKELALAILTTEGSGTTVVCQRIALKAGEYGNETDMGGLCHDSLVEVLTAALIEAGFTGATKSKAGPSAMQREWDAYRNQVYPQGLTSRQHIETHQAFYAGANVMLGLMLAATALPEDLALHTIRRLQNEILETARTRVATVGARN